MNGTAYEEEQLRLRILNLIHKKNVTQRAFAVALGRQPNNVYQILTGERHFPRGFCTDILAAYPDVNRDWLFFGDGTMFGEEQKEPHLLETRPRLPKSGTGGGLDQYYDGPKRVLCQEKPIITQFSDYDFSIILKNNGMAPKYERGDELFFKHTTIKEWGNDFLVDTKERPWFKKIFDNGNSIRCISYNQEEYPEFEIPKDMILGYYRLVGVIRIL